ncbi:hypothetical protein BGZ63DRAFT_439431 [Mariannaea sp. PMI_226]|nr:hypothetical protein BGZ63DRAFT_439431 [Mariannaea sp. PMI_226]
MLSRLVASTVATAIGLSAFGSAHPLKSRDLSVVERAVAPVFARQDDSGNTVMKPVAYSHMGGPPVNIAPVASGELLDADDFYWELPGFQASYHAISAQGGKILNAARMQNEITVDCSSQSQVVVTFKDASFMQTTQTQWQWVSDKPENTLYFVVDGDSCGGQYGREQYAIKSVAFDTGAQKATLSGIAKPWDEITDDGVLRFKSMDDGAVAAKRDEHSGTVSLEHDFSRNILNFTVPAGGQELEFALECAHCGTTGGIAYDLTFNKLKLTQGSLTAKNGLGISLGLGVSAAAAYSDSKDFSVDFGTFGIPGASFSVPGLFEIGVEISLGIDAGIGSITGKTEASIGVAMTIPDDTVFGLVGVKSSSFNPKFDLITPSITEQVSVEAHVSPVLSFGIAAKIGKEVLFSAGVAMDTPKTTAKLAATATSNGDVCGSGVAGVELDLQSEFDFSIYAGAGPASGKPNSITVYTAQPFTFPAMCVAVGTGGSGGGNNNTPSSPIKVQYYSDGGCSDYTTEFYPSTDGSCYNYQVPNTGSGNIAGCNAGICSCTFFEQPNCQGTQSNLAIFPDNCASNYGPGWGSVQCTIKN